MITYGSGDLLRADTEALVNTVNCVGVMGKGIALQFKRRYPEMFTAYEKACKRGEVTIGKMFVVDTVQTETHHQLPHQETLACTVEAGLYRRRPH